MDAFGLVRTFILVLYLTNELSCVVIEDSVFLCNKEYLFVIETGYFAEKYEKLWTRVTRTEGHFVWNICIQKLCCRKTL